MNARGVKLAYVSALCNAVIIGFSFLFTKLALDYADPLDTLTYRFLFAGAVLAIPVCMGKIRVRPLRGKALMCILLLGSMYPCSFFILQAYGLLHATSAEGGIIFAFTPILTIFLAFLFLRETATVLQQLSIALSVGGVVFIFIMKGSSIDIVHLSGLLLLSLSGLALAGYSVLARSLLRHYPPMEVTCWLVGIGCVVFLAGSIAEHARRGTLDQLAAPLAHGPFILSILYLGIMASLVTAWTANYTLSKIKASQMSVFSNLSTVISVIAGAILLNEAIAYYHVAGCIAVLVGVLGANRPGSKKAMKPKNLSI